MSLTKSLMNRYSTTNLLAAGGKPLRAAGKPQQRAGAAAAANPAARSAARSAAAQGKGAERRPKLEKAGAATGLRGSPLSAANRARRHLEAPSVRWRGCAVRDAGRPAEAAAKGAGAEPEGAGGEAARAAGGGGGGVSEVYASRVSGTR